MEQLSIDLSAALGEQTLPEPSGVGFTEEQTEAVRRRAEPILLSAAAGSGKTSVLVERFVQAVCADGLKPSAVLAITFTDRAAGELRARVRSRLLEVGDREAARDTEAAFIGTFHGFCARLLRMHPLPAGLDPDFSVLDAGRAALLRRRAYEDALVEFLPDGDAAEVDLLAAYGVDQVRATIERLHAELRSRGQRRPRLPVRAGEPEESRDDLDALAAVALFDRLLGLFSESYERLKQARAALDFDDLELIAGELLAGNDALRASWSESFELLMVDEFQDTNPRQLAILHALERGNLFTVGDELQSIYGFRHADVRLFRERRAELAAAGGALALRSNFRSRPEVLAAVNSVFAERFEDFSALVHGRREDPAPSGPLPAAVELLLTSSTDEWKTHPGAEAIAAGLPYAPLPRQAEARLLAQRVRELVDAGEVQPGEVVVLLRATGDIETFERALQLQGLRTLASVGTFWGRQQIADLHSYLRALANPRDEEALYATLASPLAGVSRNGLALLAGEFRARRSTLWETALSICRDGGGELDEPDAEVLRVFCEWFERERQEAGGRGISQLLERAIARSGYIQHVLALDWSERRIANVHKLLRLARNFEAQEGRDVRAFVDHVEHLKQASASEPEAPVEGVEPDTVRLMTVHAAKGLEFPVVCLADLGRRPPSPQDRLFVEGERLGLRLRRPGQGEGIKTLEFQELREEHRRREREEEDRVFYVAMTRARERLVLSGAVDFAKWPDEGDSSPPINWLGPALCPDLPGLGDSGAGLYTLPAGEGGPAVRITLSDPSGYGAILREPPAETRSAPRAGGEPDPQEGGAVRSGRLSAGAGASAPRGGAPVAGLPPALSYTSLALLERCGYRYYLERVLRMPEEQVGGAVRATGELEARARGTLIHRLLERHDLANAAGPDERLVSETAVSLGLKIGGDEPGEIAALISNALASPVGRRLAAAPRRRAEHPFAFSIDDQAPLITGVIDLLCEEADGTALVVDYKSDRLAAEADTEHLVAGDYAVQRLLYALAVLREGALVVEVVHWFLERPGEPAVARYTLTERPSLEEELARRLADDWADPFAVTRRPHRSLCLTCPGRGGMCSWSEEETMREDPGEAAEAGDPGLETTR
ncbi:MAG: family ATPase [Solirubrobacterales bacterium]|nr:family ATPase [Solirubrobacterales bacterium]